MLSKNKISIIHVLWVIVLALMTLSELPFLKESIASSIMNILSFVILGIIILFGGIGNKISFKQFGGCVILLCLYFLILVISTLFSDINYLSFSLNRYIIISFLTLILSYLSFSNNKKQISIDFLNETYIIFLSILSLFAIAFSVKQGFTLDSRTHFYGAGKNLVGFLFSIGMILCLYNFFNKKTIRKVISVSEFLILLLGVFFVQCRAAMVSFAMGILYLFFSSKAHLKYKVRAGIILFTLILIVGFNESLRGLLVSFFEAGRDSGSINDLSSGRIDDFNEAFSLFKENPFFGHGDHYIDNFFIYSLTSIGIISFIPLLIYLIYVWKQFGFRKTKNRSLMITMIIMLLTNMMFEAYSPFGTGTRVFYIWMLFAYNANTLLLEKNKNVNFK